MFRLPAQQTQRCMVRDLDILREPTSNVGRWLHYVTRASLLVPGFPRSNVPQRTQHPPTPRCRSCLGRADGAFCTEANIKATPNWLFCRTSLHVRRRVAGIVRRLRNVVRITRRDILRDGPGMDGGNSGQAEWQCQWSIIATVVLTPRGQLLRRASRAWEKRTNNNHHAVWSST